MFSPRTRDEFHREILNFGASRADRRARLDTDIGIVSRSGVFAEMVTIDLSRHGVGVDGLLQFQPGEAVTVCFGDRIETAGTVRWHEAFFCGIQFDEPLSEVQVEKIVHHARP